MRVLGLDYGSARCGCAVSDPTGTVVTPLHTIDRPASRRGLDVLRALVAERDAGCVVVGLPLTLGGTDSDQTREARRFAQRLARRLGEEVPVELHDERLTTRIAQSAARAGGGARAPEDSRAAAHMLEGWLAARARARDRPQPLGCFPAMPSGNSQRTAEDRERARIERERRRQGTNGNPPTAPPVERPTQPQVEALAESQPPAQPIAEPESFAEAQSPPVELEPRPIAAKPSPPGLPPRIAPPPEPAESRRGRWPARARVGALLVLVLAALGALLAFVLGRAGTKPKRVAPLAVVTITIPEGETRAQIAQIAAAKGLRGSYLKAARRSPLLNPARYGAPRTTHDLEGFLFPATYELYAGAPASQLVAEQLSAFGENFGSQPALRAHALHVTSYQLLIVASMVEREALLQRDRARVAAVIYNRLHLGMPLGIDSTIRYALHDYTKPLTEAQLQIESPYNTRTHQGLPPTPISNPGLASIDAAAHPAHVPYLYYVNGADGCGELAFSTSNAQFEHNAAAYREALARNGGRVPSCRKR
jgi:UPF0755 protein